MLKVKVFEIFKKLIAYDKKAEIYINGEDNAYPERVDRLINNSVTAKMASSIMAQYLMGKGFGKEVNKQIINTENNTTIIQFAESLAHELVENRGFFVHINYEINNNGEVVPTDPKVLPFDWCRLGKKDAKDYNSKIHVKSDWNNKKEEAEKYDVFNPKKNVIEKQIENAGGITKYKGQIFYYNPDFRYYYPLSRIDSVMDDCDSEAQASSYKNTLLRKGFFGKTLVVTRPLVDVNVEEYYIDEESGERRLNHEYTEMQTEADEVTDSIEDFLGADNAGGAMLVQLDNAGEKLDDAIMVKNIDANIDANMFQGVEESTRANILIAFKNLPIGLVKASESLFGNSGELLKEMKNTYWENTEKEREVFEMFMNKFVKMVYPELELNVIPLIQTQVQEDKTE